MNVNRRRSILTLLMISIFFLTSGGSPPIAGAQGTVVTVLAVIESLEKVTGELEGLLRTAEGATKSVGASLQANAQNVLLDLDQMLGDKLLYTVDRLNDTEKQLVEDAEKLIEQMNRASEALVRSTGEEARRTLAEADIVAYNASYSLPCRSQIPRMVYSVPEVLVAGKDPPEVRIRGNFLSHGESPEITVGDFKAELISRNANEYVLRFPDELLSSIDREQTVGISAKPVALKARNFWVFCYKQRKTVEEPLSVPVLLRPRTSVDIKVSLTPTAELPEEREFKETYWSGRESDCDASYSVDQDWCLPKEWEVKTWEIRGKEEHCKSQITAQKRSGYRCVFIEAKVEGCGYGPFCRGRGWLRYHLHITGVRWVRKPLESFSESLSSADGSQRSFTLDYEGTVPRDARRIEWRYHAEVVISVGESQETIEISDANPNSGRVSSRMREGRLAIEVD